MPPPSDPAPDDLTALRAALAAEQRARREAEARASGAEAMVTHLKLMIAKLRHEQFGATSERGSKLLDQLELQLEELEATAAEDEAVLDPDAAERAGRRPVRRKPVRGPLPAHLPRERVVIPGPTTCPCCQGRLVQARRGRDRDPGDRCRGAGRSSRPCASGSAARCARRPARRPRRSTRSPADVPDPSCWRLSWTRSSDSTCR